MTVPYRNLYDLTRGELFELLKGLVRQKPIVMTARCEKIFAAPLQEYLGSLHIFFHKSWSVKRLLDLALPSLRRESPEMLVRRVLWFTHKDGVEEIVEAEIQNWLRSQDRTASEKKFAALRAQCYKKRKKRGVL